MKDVWKSRRYTGNVWNGEVEGEADKGISRLEVMWVSSPGR